MRKTSNKILVVSNFAESLILFRLTLLIDLKRQGYDVAACAPELNESVVSKLEQHGIRFIQIKLAKAGLNPIFDIYASWILYKIFRKEKPDIILNYTLKPVVYGSLMGYFARVPKIFSVITGFGSVFIENSKKINPVRSLVKKLYWLAFKTNEKVFCLNPDILEYFTTKKVLPKTKTVLINGEGLDIGYYSLKPLPLVNCPVFLMVARLLKDKGIYEYVNAARCVKQKYPLARFLIVGGHDANPSALKQSEVDRISAGKIVELLGHHEDVRPIITKSSVFVLPSYAEGVPRSTLEAMSMGRPIITTDSPGCRETVVDGKNGFLVPIRNAEKLAAAMENFILQPELISIMGKESRMIVEERFDVRKVNKQILSSMNIT